MAIIKKISKIVAFIFIIGIISIQFFAFDKTNSNGELYASSSIEINDSVHKVFKYMGNSDNARNWSVYVDHISLLSGEDGAVNCKRRCFKEKNEKGIQWDEEILKIIPNQKRVLSIYNGKNFPIYSDNLITEQQYLDKGNSTELKLILTLKGKQSFLENFKFKFSTFVVHYVFNNNLENIKKEIEQR